MGDLTIGCAECGGALMIDSSVAHERSCPLASPAPPREPTAERCEQINVFGERCAREHGHAADLLHLFGAEGRELMNLRAQLSREVEARRRAEELHAIEKDRAQALWRDRDHWRAKEGEARAALATEQEAHEKTKRVLASTITAHEDAMRERDDARQCVLDSIERSLDDVKHWKDEAARAESALATATGRVQEAERRIGEAADCLADASLDPVERIANARADLNEIMTALAAPPPSPSATREGAQFRVGAGHPWEAWHGDIVTVVGPGNPEVCTEEDCTHHAHLSVTGDWSAEGLPVIDLEPLNEKARELLATIAPPPRETAAAEKDGGE